MKFKILSIFILLLIIPVSGKTEVYITLEKDLVATGDTIRIDVHVSCSIPSQIEILIKGSNNGEWLYNSNGEKIEKLNKTWNFQIPEDWESGTYLVKVNVIENSTTSEFFEQFKVVKPKILSIESLEVPYQGRSKVIVKVETPDENKTSLSFKFVGLNFRFESKEDFKPNKNVTELFLNLREKYDATRDIDYALKPGTYAIEVRMKFGGKLYESRMATLEVVKPRLSVRVSEEVIAGEPILVEISTNRRNDTFNGDGYRGIILTLVGENYKSVKLVELDKYGSANVTFETAGLSEGDYKLYIRDTCLTLKGMDLRIFGLLHYDLDPKDYLAKNYHANDDLLVVKEIKIMKIPKSKPKSILFFEPTDQKVDEGDIVSYKIVLSSAENGLSAYELILNVSNASVAKINNIYFPEWAYETYKVISNDYAKLNAIDLKGEINKGANRVELATITLKALEEGFTEIGVVVNRLDSENGSPIKPICYKAYLVVDPLPLEEINEIEKLLNSSLEFETETSGIYELEEEYERIISPLENYTLLSMNYDFENNLTSEILSKKSPILKPKERKVLFEDFILMFGVGVAFVLVLRKGRLSK
ncbi:MAG: hypothetical protein NZ872_05385 [Archaeoglobaceae archaeon]|nr:hypothetical protein [Archaeoglobaceae archaeon]MDW8128631.1 hypothetical protein [Archaeoglobaceae archaeon]